MNRRHRRLSWPERLWWTSDLIAFHVHTWIFTRRLGLLAQGLPALLLAVGFLVLWIGQGDGPDRDLISRYDLAVERALASDDLVSAKVYVRKLVLLDEPGPRTRYALARLAEHEGDLPRASRLMSDLAPYPGSGYPAAHFWVAQRLLDQQSSRFAGPPDRQPGSDSSLGAVAAVAGKSPAGPPVAGRIVPGPRRRRAGGQVPGGGRAATAGTVPAAGRSAAAPPGQCAFPAGR